MVSSVALSVSYGMTGLTPQDWEERDDWEFASEGKPWRVRGYGYTGGDGDCSIVIEDSISSVEIYYPLHLKERLVRNQAWDKIVWDACKELGVPFKQENCGWFVSGLWFE